jgi:hypothetical protein
MYRFLKTLVGFEPWIFCSVGGRDDHYATPPGLCDRIYKSLVIRFLELTGTFRVKKCHLPEIFFLNDFL